MIAGAEVGLCRESLLLTGSSIIADTKAVARAAPPHGPARSLLFCWLFPRSGPADAPPARAYSAPGPSVAPAALGLCGVRACSAALAPVGPGRSNWRRRQSVAAAALRPPRFCTGGGRFAAAVAVVGGCPVVLGPMWSSALLWA